MPKIVDVDQRRAELADATARVIARAGIDGASMRCVAAEAGWTTGTLSHYFANKRELLAFTLETSLDRLSARAASRVDLAPADELRALLVDALPITDESRLHWVVTLAFAAQAATDDELASIQQQANQQFLAYIAERQDGNSAQRRAEAERIAVLVDGIALQALFDPAAWPPNRQVAALDAGLGLCR